MAIVELCSSGVCYILIPVAVVIKYMFHVSYIISLRNDCGVSLFCITGKLRFQMSLIKVVNSCTTI